MAFSVGRVCAPVRLFRRLAERRGRGTDGGGDSIDAGSDDTDEGRNYVCTLCGARFAERAVVVCPECRGFVVERGE
jgi:rubrerythrin